MAGLMEILLGKESPVTQWTGRNSNLLTGLGTSLLSDGMNFQPAQVGATLDRQAAAQKDADAKLAASTQAGSAALRKQGFIDLADAVDANALPLSDAWNEGFKRMQPGYGQTGGNEYQERFTAGQQYGLSDQDLNTFALTGALPGTNRQNVTYGTTPVWGMDPETKQMGYGVTGSDGTFKRVDTGGMQVLNPYDLNANKAAGTAFGSATGGAQIDLPMAAKELEQSLAAIKNLGNDDVAAGKEDWFKQAGALPRGIWVQGGSNMAKFQVAANNVIDRSWLSARAMLKGGGPITDYESNKAENAVSMMKGALEKSDKTSYDDAVIEYEYWIKQGFAKLQQQAGAMPGYGGAPATAGSGIDDLLTKYGS